MEREIREVHQDEWKTNNPNPYTGYFPRTSAGKMKSWYISLGPLGVSTLMHDRSWVDIFKACGEISPPLLTDECGLVKNAYEVKVVKSGSPAEGLLKAGDLILAMDGRELQEAQLTFLGKPLDSKDCRA